MLTRLVATCALAAASLGLAGAAATLAACESATNLDVKYGDASSALETGSTTSPDAEAGAGDAGEAGVVSPGVTGCPCDPTEGLGCCMPASGAPFCTADTTVCVNKMGTHLRCVRPDPSTESVCCWHGHGGVAETAFAAVCDGGPAACTADTDCAGTGETKCAMALCFGGTIAIGACGSVPPTCPQP